MSIHKLLIFILLLVFTGVSFLNAQHENHAIKHFQVLKGQQVYDTIYARFMPSAQAGLINNCLVQVVNIGAVPGALPPLNKYKVTISSSQTGYVGYANAGFQYITGPPYKPFYIRYKIRFVNSEVMPEDDFVSYDSESSVGIRPEPNDMHTDSAFIIRGISHVEGGSASLIGDSIVFTPDSLAAYGNVLYSTKDSYGATASAMIHFTKRVNSYPTSDTLQYKVYSTRKQYIFLPDAGFLVSGQGPQPDPSLGTLSLVGEQVFRYEPNPFASGIDTFLLTKGGVSRLVVIQIIPATINKSSVKDDVFYTTKNTSVTFNVFSNDLSSGYPIVQHSPELTAGNNPGEFIYNPPADFSGSKNFSYTVNYGSYQYTGKIEIIVNDFVPEKEREYYFSVYQYDTLQLTYDVPVGGYTFIHDSVLYADTIYCYHDTIIGDACSAYYSKAHIIYPTLPNFQGEDYFSVRYCLPSGECTTLKFYINVVGGTPDGECHCSGPDCVWAGDLNGDGQVSITDLLSLGRYMGLAGPARNDIAYPFRYGQYADDWYYDQPNGKSISHADANGDGLISIQDTVAISNHFGTVSTLVSKEVLGIKEYPFGITVFPSSADSGDLVTVEFSLGTPTVPVKDIMGLTFGIDLATGAIDSSTLASEFYKGNWFSQYTQTVSMVKQPKDGKIKIGYTRILGIVEDELEGIKPRGANGNGSLGKFTFIVEDELEGIRSEEGVTDVRISTEEIILEDAEGNRFQLPDAVANLRINRTKTPPVPTPDKLLVYPNPTSDILYMHFNGGNIIEGVRIFDTKGSLMLHFTGIGSQSTSLDMSTLSNGLYIAQVYTSQGMVSKKIMVVR